MSEYWKMHWQRHMEEADDNPFSQVARTLNKQPMSEAMFLKMTAHLIKKLELEPDHMVLDFCCGNGLFSTEMAPNCQHITAVDFCEKLIRDMEQWVPENVSGVVSDALEIKFQPESFHRILFAAALQQFTQVEVIRLFKSLCRWLKPGGLLLVSDILDSRRIWEFFNNEEREDIYFQNTMEEIPVMGTWLDHVWLEKLSRHSGFSHAQVLDQPEDYWYAHYRFDLLCRK